MTQDIYSSGILYPYFQKPFQNHHRDLPPKFHWIRKSFLRQKPLCLGHVTLVFQVILHPGIPKTIIFSVFL